MFHVKHSPPNTTVVSRETQAKLQIYADLVTRWNPAINLFSRTDIQALWSRHIADALQLLPLLPPQPSHAIDLGSGGGIPGIVLAIATGAQFHLIEADTRKCAFLREVARETGAAVIVHNMRIEAATLASAPLITARALAPLPKLLALVEPFLASDTIFIAPKGETALTELTAARKEWHMRVECVQSATHPAALILKMSEVRRVGSKPQLF